MKQRVLISVICALFASPAFASTWHYIGVGNNDAQLFFDAETVEKNREITTIWMKAVQMTGPGGDGSWSTASRWRMNCSKRTIQILAWSAYAMDGKFIKSNSNPGQETLVIPDSTGEAILKIACEASFPRDTASDKYFKVEDNDVFQFTKNYVEYQKSQVDTAPK